ncbi:hypothetical protein D3C73_901450 [compost metagenome]
MPLPIAPHGIRVWLNKANTMTSRGFKPSGRISNTVPSMPTPNPVADSAKGPIRKQAKNKRRRRASGSFNSGCAAVACGGDWPCEAICQNSRPPRM